MLTVDSTYHTAVTTPAPGTAAVAPSSSFSEETLKELRAMRKLVCRVEKRLDRVEEKIDQCFGETAARLTNVETFLVKRQMFRRLAAGPRALTSPGWT